MKCSNQICTHSVPETFASYCFFQLNSITNESVSILDIVFCNQNNLTIVKFLETLFLTDTYHTALLIIIPYIILLPIIEFVLTITSLNLIFSIFLPFCHLMTDILRLSHWILTRRSTHFMRFCINL